MNIGEENCGEYLRWFKGCDFVQYNTKLIDAQGEIDVVGINLADRIVCACEVATIWFSDCNTSRTKGRIMWIG